MATVLVVDDVQPIRLQLRLLLEDEGHQVVEADSGGSAIRALEDDTFDLVVSDIVMPDGDGIELIKELGQRWPGIKILAISGGGEKLAASWSLRMSEMFGAHAVLYKPFDNERLLEKVRELLAA